MPQAVVRLALVGASMGAGLLGNKVLEKGWGAIFGEDVPTDANRKQAEKEYKSQVKEAKKAGDELPEPPAEEDLPLWKILLWTVVSGIVLQSLQYAAQKGAVKLLERRPRANRG